jgi:hypothetical protein
MSKHKNCGILLNLINPFVFQYANCGCDNIYFEGTCVVESFNNFSSNG